MRLPNLGKAKELAVSEWLNVDEPLQLENLQGKVIVLYAFQMLCPGCVSHGLPQIKKIQHAFANDDVQVLGIHTVFEHHQAMNPDALRAFAYEYRLDFPIAIDQPSKVGPIPETMMKYQLSGTPSLVVIDKDGYVRFQHLGIVDDLVIGHALGTLLTEQSNHVGSTIDDQKKIADEVSTEQGAIICNDDHCEVKR
ncbi:peroxiredoxin family protein [Veronia pacifica]|uniref:Thioredoxin domain-containing protein n=2 Tax=Veronia pacifica TaxID=1080227 RepID=A0A1C3EG09_9GAMM|nr:hypothetical protein A8L45_14145 [Veronia pacifica]